MKNIKKLVLASILASLATVFLIVGSVFEILDLTISAIASFAVIISVIELKPKYGFGVFVVSSVLGLIFMPTRTAPLYYVFFLGWYPILKYALAKTNRFVSWVVKLSAFNTGGALLIIFFKSLFGIKAFTAPLVLGLLVCGNVFFVVYDLALSGIIMLYIVKFRKMLGLGKLFK